MRFGYFLAGKPNQDGELGLKCGDPELAQIAEGLWNFYGTPTPGYKNTGCSIWISNNQLTVNLIVPDFFSEVPKVQQVRKSRDLPTQNKIIPFDYKYKCKLCDVIHTANVKDKYDVVQFPPTLITSRDKDGKWFAHCKTCNLF